MKLAIVGTGDMGGALAAALAQRRKYEIFVRGSRQGSPSALDLARQIGGAEAGDRDLIDADVVFVVVPWGALDAASRLLARCKGIVVSVVVPWDNGGDPRTNMTSAAERLAARLPGRRIVNAFTSGVHDRVCRFHCSCSCFLVEKRIHFEFASVMSRIDAMSA